MAVKIQIRGGTAAEWTSANPVLAAREMAIETDTDKFKFGDGVTAWNSLPYAGGGPPGGGTVESVTGDGVDNTDSVNPVIRNASATQKGAVELATPAETTTGTDTERAVTPEGARAAYPNGLEAVDVTGTAIQFDVPKTYGSVATPETGNITLNTTGFRKGMVQLCLHNNGTEPTFGSEFKRMTGSYITGVLNSIYMHAVSTTRIEYSILQVQS